jgi:DNA topoisomerase IA
MTAFNSKTGGFHLTTVGRVQTPTLAIVVDREKKIREFKPRPYWEVEGEFAAKAGTCTCQSMKNWPRSCRIAAMSAVSPMSRRSM